MDVTEYRPDGGVNQKRAVDLSLRLPVRGAEIGAVEVDIPATTRGEFGPE